MANVNRYQFYQYINQQTTYTFRIYAQYRSWTLDKRYRQMIYNQSQALHTKRQSQSQGRISMEFESAYYNEMELIESETHINTVGREAELSFDPKSPAPLHPNDTNECHSNQSTPSGPSKSWRDTLRNLRVRSVSLCFLYSKSLVKTLSMCSICTPSSQNVIEQNRVIPFAEWWEMRRANESSADSGNVQNTNIPTFDGNKNKFAPKLQNPNKKMAEKPTTTHQETNANALPESSKQDKVVKDREDAKLQNEQSGNVESKVLTELSVEIEILKRENERLKKSKEQEINYWKEQYKHCKLELERLKQSKQQ